LQGYALFADLCRAMGFDMPEKYAMSPESPEFQQKQANPQKPPEVLAKEMELKADAQKFQAQSQLEQQKAQADLQQEQLRSQNDVAIEREKITAQMELERWKAQLQAETQLQIAQMNAAMKAQSEANREPYGA
jgi:hypothetical protein